MLLLELFGCGEGVVLCDLFDFVVIECIEVEL